MGNAETGYLESCCWTFARQHCPGRGCACRCHAEMPIREQPDCGHAAELERLRQRSRDEDAARIRLNHERIRLRDAITEALYDYDHGDEVGCIDRLRGCVR